MKEEWRDIPGMVGYQASSLGRIRSLTRIVMKKIHAEIPRPHLRPGRIMKLDQARGYFRVCIHGEKHHVHWLVLAAFNRPRKKDEICRHLNGCRSDNRPENLKWGSYAENYEDSREHGTNCKGSRHGKSKLTEASAKQAKEMIARGVSLTEIARKLGVTPNTIGWIKKGVTWTHV